MLHSRINYAYRRQREYLEADRTWGARHAGVLRPRPVAYFSAEFGLHESVPEYSGGLGVLAGDHIKSASDLGIPLIGIGLFYGQGYFRQRLDKDGWQQEEYLQTDVNQLPMEPAIGANGEPVTVQIETRSGSIRAKVWRMKVGTLRSAAPRFQRRRECARGPRTHFAPVRRRRAHSNPPGVAAGRRRLPRIEGHGNHARRAAPERRAQRICGARSDSQPHGGRRPGFRRAVPRVSREVVFTTHTPVPAGHDRFDAGLIEEHLGPLRESLGLSHERLMALGRENPNNSDEEFCMTVLGLKLSRRANAVSALHGEVSRAMWTGLYPGKPEDAVPIGHITNGVHVPSWLAPQMFRLYDRHLGTGWHEHSGEAQIWEGIENVDDGELWETHLSLKSRLLEFVRAARGGAGRAPRRIAENVCKGWAEFSAPTR